MAHLEQEAAGSAAGGFDCKIRHDNIAGADGSIRLEKTGMDPYGYALKYQAPDPTSRGISGEPPPAAVEITLMDGLHCEFSPSDKVVAYCLRALMGSPNYAIVGTSLITTKEVVRGADVVREQLRISVQYPTTNEETDFKNFIVLEDRDGCGSAESGDQF
jgi:hypothetical protein